jgi:hypothetical protein
MCLFSLGAQYGQGQFGALDLSSPALGNGAVAGRAIRSSSSSSKRGILCTTDLAVCAVV